MTLATFFCIESSRNDCFGYVRLTVLKIGRKFICHIDEAPTIEDRTSNLDVKTAATHFASLFFDNRVALYGVRVLFSRRTVLNLWVSFWQQYARSSDWSIGIQPRTIARRVPKAKDITERQSRAYDNTSANTRTAGMISVKRRHTRISKKLIDPQPCPHSDWYCQAIIRERQH